MKQLFQMAACAVLLTVPAVSSAQSTRAITLGASGGLSLPIGDISDVYGSGYSVAGHIFLTPASRSSLSFRGDVTYDKFETKSNATLLDGSLTSLAFLGNAMIHLGSADGATKRPYVLVGGGLLRSTATRTGPNVGISAEANDLAIQGGVGMEFMLSGFSTFFEVKYVNGFLEGGNLNYIPITFGIKF